MQTAFGQLAYRVLLSVMDAEIGGGDDVTLIQGSDHETPALDTDLLPISSNASFRRLHHLI